MKLFATIWAGVQAVTNLWGYFTTPEYDVIVVGAGAAGSPLAQTLAESGLSVLLIERGGEAPKSSDSILTQDDAFRDDCAETFSSSGVRVTTGNCMGGATAINQGIYVEETPDWFVLDDGTPIFTKDEILDGYAYVRDRVAPEPSYEEPGTGSAEWISGMFEALNASSRFLGVMPEGAVDNAVRAETGMAWRARSIFHPTTRKRRSAASLIDRNVVDVRFANVRSLKYDGDWLLPFNVETTTDETNRVRCVVTSFWEQICVKKEGRIYLSAGAIHTPEILMRAGISESGDRVQNAHVGQHLQDKPGLALGTTPEPEFDNRHQVTYSHIAATNQYNNLELLHEELSMGNSGSLLNAAAYERNIFPLHLRDSFWANVLTNIADICKDQTDNWILYPLCFSLVDLVDANCDGRVTGLASLIGTPTSTGSVTVSRGLFGGLDVNVNYLSSDDEKRAFGFAARTNVELLKAVEGPARAQRPCEDDPLDEACLEDSCPDILADFFGLSKRLIRIVAPGFANDLPLKDPSTVQPEFIESAVDDLDDDDDDLALGEIAMDAMIGAHHLAGTAAFGKVIHTDFSVMETSGLYVVDGSALIRTVPINPMASIMMMGRVAGKQAAAAMT